MPTTLLRDIGGIVRWRHVSGAFLPVGGMSDVRYLLPRILDIALDDPEKSNPVAQGAICPDDRWLSSADAGAGDLHARFPAVARVFREAAPTQYAIVARWLAALAPEAR